MVAWLGFQSLVVLRIANFKETWCYINKYRVLKYKKELMKNLYIYINTHIYITWCYTLYIYVQGVNAKKKTYGDSQNLLGKVSRTFHSHCKAIRRIVNILKLQM